MTIKTYLHLNAPLSATAVIAHIEPGDIARVRLDHTIFHPKGGGQLPDTGTLDSAKILDVRHAPDGEVDHFVRSSKELYPGTTVTLSVDAPARHFNSRLHTAGHLVAAVLAEPFPTLRPVQAHHYPGEARVEFCGDAGMIDLVKSALPTLLTAAICEDLVVQVEGDPENGRSVRIGNYPSIPCGGTHVQSLAELVAVEISSVRVKGGRIRVSYQVEAFS